MHGYFRYLGKYRKAQSRNLKITLILPTQEIVTFSHFGDSRLLSIVLKILRVQNAFETPVEFYFNSAIHELSGTMDGFQVKS